MNPWSSQDLLDIDEALNEEGPQFEGISRKFVKLSGLCLPRL